MVVASVHLFEFSNYVYLACSVGFVQAIAGLSGITKGWITDLHVVWSSSCTVAHE